MCILMIELIWVAIYGKREEKLTFWAKFEGPVPVQVRAVPVQVVLCFSILTSICILAITCSFLIRFELLKFLVKIDFKENQKYRNRNLQIRILCGPKI